MSLFKFSSVDARKASSAGVLTPFLTSCVATRLGTSYFSNKIIIDSDKCVSGSSSELSLSYRGCRDMVGCRDVLSVGVDDCPRGMIRVLELPSVGSRIVRRSIYSTVRELELSSRLYLDACLVPACGVLL